LTFTAVFDECQHFEWILKIYQQSPMNVNIYMWMLLRIIKTLSYLEWWAENSILLNLYSWLSVKSKLDYGSICYGNSNCNIKYLTRILSTPDNSTIVVAVDNEF